MPLTGRQVSTIQSALLSAFPDPTGLAQCVRIHLNVNLAEITTQSGLRAVTFDLIVWAESTGRVADLLRGVFAARPGNAAVQALARSYPNGHVPTPSAPETIGEFRAQVQRSPIDRTTLQDIVNEMIVQRRVMWESMDAELPDPVARSLDGLAALCDAYRRDFNAADETAALGDAMSAWMNECRLAVRLLRSRPIPARSNVDMQYFAYVLATFRRRALERGETFVRLLPKGPLKEQAADKLRQGHESIANLTRLFRVDLAKLDAFVSNPERLESAG